MEKSNSNYVTKKNKKKKLTYKTLSLHLMLLPAVILLIIYNYIPMLGISMAFQKFDLGLGWKAIFKSPWVGLDNFRRVLVLQGSEQALINTLIISLFKIITMLVVPIIITLLLNEIRKTFVKRSIQTLIYLPHFLSWVILGGVIKTLLASDGIVNILLLKYFGIHSIQFLGIPSLFPHILVWTNVWKEFGFSTIVYLAAITNVDVALYEAASIDGANKFQQVFAVTLPAMKPIIVLMGVLSLGGILNAGFDQVFNLYNVQVYSTGDIIDTFVYRISIQGGQYELGTAVGLFKSVVSLIFISFSYWAAYRFADYEIF